jgi:hypothetical protein
VISSQKISSQKRPPNERVCTTPSTTGTRLEEKNQKVFTGRSNLDIPFPSPAATFHLPQRTIQRCKRVKRTPMPRPPTFIENQDADLFYHSDCRRGTTIHIREQQITAPVREVAMHKNLEPLAYRCHEFSQ